MQRQQDVVIDCTGKGVIMKAEILKGSVLSITPSNPTEVYAMETWRDHIIVLAEADSIKPGIIITAGIRIEKIRRIDNG